MSTIIKQSVQLSTKNPLFKSPTDEYGNVKFTLNEYSADEFYSKSTLVTYSLHFQRYYIFNNPPGDKGHPWQQNLFANMITYQPLGTIEWVRTIYEDGELSKDVESMDGQQRTKTYLDIRDNKVRLPKNTFIWFNGKKEDVRWIEF